MSNDDVAPSPAAPQEQQTSTLPPAPAAPEWSQTVPYDVPHMDGSPSGGHYAVEAPLADTTFLPESGGTSSSSLHGLVQHPDHLQNHLTSNTYFDTTNPETPMLPCLPDGSKVVNSVLGKTPASAVNDSTTTISSSPATSRLWFAVEIPADQRNHPKFLGDIKSQLAAKGVSAIGIFIGTSHRHIPSVVIEVATPYQLNKAKKLFPAVHEVKVTGSSACTTSATSVILVNKAKSIDLSVKEFRSVLEEFGPTNSLTLTQRNNVKANFADVDSAKKCLEAGAVYVRGRRYVSQAVPSDDDATMKPTLYSAWLLDLPSFCTDAHLTYVLPSSVVDWQVMKTYGRDMHRQTSFAKVWFASEEERSVAVNSTLIFLEKRREWTIPPVCVICKDENHQAMLCPKRQIKSSAVEKKTASLTSNFPKSYRSLFQSDKNVSEPTRVETAIRRSGSGLEKNEVVVLVEDAVAARMANQDQFFHNLVPSSYP